MIEFKIIDCFDSADSKLDEYLEWWSDKTYGEPKMLEKSVDFFKKNLLYAAFAFHDNVLVGACGLIPCLGNSNLFLEDKHVVELASNYVDPLFRNRDIATKFVEMRLDYCKVRNYFPVSVTANAYIQKIFTQRGLIMTKHKEYDHIYQQVRYCHCSEKSKFSCRFCSLNPLRNKAVWIFRDFI